MKAILLVGSCLGMMSPVLASEILVPPQSSLQETGVGGVYFDSFNINQDILDQPTDTPAVRQARTDLRNAKRSFEASRADLGWDHPQAQSAMDSLQKAEIALHREIGDLDHSNPDWGVAQQNEVQSLAQKYVPPASSYNFEMDVQDQSTDNDLVRQDRAKLRELLTSSQEACSQQGANSAACEAAQARINQAEVSLQKNLNALALQNL